VGTVEKRWGEGRVAFMAKLPEIQTALDAGQSLRMIYDAHEAALGISYSNFARYVAKHLRSQTNASQASKDRPQQSSSFGGRSGDSPKPAEPAKPGVGQPTFKHRATGGNDDLV